MNQDKKNIALVLIDVQKGFDDSEYWGGGRNNPDAEKVCAQLLTKFRQLQLPVYHIRHASTLPQSLLHPSHRGFAFHDCVLPIEDEIVITKHVNSGFIGTDLHEKLTADGINTLVIAGLTTDHCVSTTTRMAGNLGYNVYLISDATATFDKVGINGEKFEAELIHQTALASLNGEFATVINSNQLLNSLTEKYDMLPGT